MSTEEVALMRLGTIAANPEPPKLVADDVLQAIVLDNRKAAQSTGATPTVGVADTVRVVTGNDGAGWVTPPSVDDWRPPGERAFNQLMDAEDAKWRAQRKRELGDG